MTIDFSQVLFHCSYWGEPVKWGPNNKQPTAEACCADCHAHQPADAEELECNGMLCYCLKLAPLQMILLVSRHVDLSLVCSLGVLW